MNNKLSTNDDLVDRKRAAKYLGISPETLAVWKCTKRYELDCIKIGRSVRYRMSDLKKFVDERLTS
ncbi:helix-turn-helix domain-containing protein [Arcicella lustrica]|uniref:helix-turn-helix domain-containing protein n=1 Tax=Arcicella lustrica TaxID=2984196 RepID=UPI002B2007C4|nr:helix-turn-helix domain-containing protein [Arcicella sp. DC25W]